MLPVERYARFRKYDRTVTMEDDKESAMFSEPMTQFAEIYFLVCEKPGKISSH